MSLKLVVAALAMLLALVQVDLWFGKGGVPAVASLQSQLNDQRVANDAARARNARLAAEVNDLAEGIEMVEEKARGELGMIKPNEILVQIGR